MHAFHPLPPLPRAFCHHSHPFITFCYNTPSPWHNLSFLSPTTPLFFLHPPQHFFCVLIPHYLSFDTSQHNDRQPTEPVLLMVNQPRSPSRLSLPKQSVTSRTQSRPRRPTTSAMSMQTSSPSGVSRSTSWPRKSARKSRLLMSRQRRNSMRQTTSLMSLRFSRPRKQSMSSSSDLCQVMSHFCFK